MVKTVEWRGLQVDPDTAAMLDAIAKNVGDDILVKGIPGYGSYRDNKASGGTDTGGGHADLSMVGYTDEQCRRLETVARSFGACAYFRPERRPDGTRYGWQRHVHILRIDCPDLSTAARLQVADYLRGYDGLYYPNNVKHKDTGDRRYVSRRWLVISKPKVSNTVAKLSEDDVRDIFTTYKIMKDWTSSNPNDPRTRVAPSNVLEDIVKIGQRIETKLDTLIRTLNT